MKRLFIINLAVVLSLWLFYSCKKDKTSTTIVKVTVIDKTNSNPIANAKVTLLKVAITSTGSGYTQIPIENKYTDASGKCSFNFDADEDYDYYLGAQAEKYYGENGNGNYISSIEIRKENNETIPLQPEAHLKIIVHKTPPCNSESISISYFGSDPAGGGIIINCQSGDFATTGRVQGNTNTEVNYYTFADSSYGKISVYCPAFDTTVYTINY